MSSPDYIEAIVLRTSATETKANGLTRTVTFLLPNDGPHPFTGMVGERLHLVAVSIGDNETPAASRSGSVGEAVSRSVSASPAAAKTPLRPAQKAGMLCGEPKFWAFLREKHGFHVVGGKDGAADVLRLMLDVESRTELNPDHPDHEHPKLVLFHQLCTDYDVWSGRLPEPR